MATPRTAHEVPEGFVVRFRLKGFEAERGWKRETSPGSIAAAEIAVAADPRAGSAIRVFAVCKPFRARFPAGIPVQGGFMVRR